METIQLNNGMSFTGDTFESEGVLTITLDNQTMDSVYPIVSVPDNIKKIISTIGSDKKVYTGYKHAFYIREERDGSVTVGMKKA